MKRTTFRIFLVLAIASIMGVIVVQYYWFIKAFDLKQTDLDHRISIALQEVAERIVPIERRAASFFQPVNQESSNYFKVMVNDVIDPAILEEFLKLELAKHAITLNFEYGIYDCQTNDMEYCKYVCATGNCEPLVAEARYDFPAVSEADSYYFGVYFPTKESYLINQMGIWLYSTLVVLLVILFFSYSLFVIVRQKRLSEIQTDFINTMTHEFKTPISTIDISATVLMNPAIVDSPQRLLSYASIIKAEATRLRNQVEKVLQVAVMDNRSEDLKLAPISMNALLQEYCKSMAAKLESHQGTLTLDLQAAKDRMMGDVLHLTNILNNLTDNSIKYSEEAPHLRISTSNDLKGRLLVVVEDNGIGIGEKERKMIFDKFYRVPTGDVHNVKGFGLGLHYVKMMVEAHKGTISVSSKPGKGTAFCMAFRPV